MPRRWFCARLRGSVASSFSIDFVKLCAREGHPLDGRGLMPVDAARAHLKDVRIYQRENADLVWGALLSLEDAEEFVSAANRLEWRFPMLRGWENRDAVVRFGVGALPWLETLLDRIKGKVGAIPALPFFFVCTHLLALGPEALNAVLRVRKEGDADPDGLGFVTEWLERQGEPAWDALVRSTSPEALRAVDALKRRAPKDVAKYLKRAGLTGKRSKQPLSAEAILRVLDAAATAPMSARIPWPSMHSTSGHFEFHAMRVIAVRQEGGDHWGVLVEVVQGDLLDPKAEWPAVVQQYTWGSKVQSGGRYLLDSRPLPPKLKKVKVDGALEESLDLRRGYSVTGAVERWDDVLAIRAALASDKVLLFPPATKVAKVLKVPKARVLVVSDAFEHVEGVIIGKGELARLPSSSVAWRSIAEVLATRDPKRFDAGKNTVDWRLHAVAHGANRSVS